MGALEILMAKGIVQGYREEKRRRLCGGQFGVQAQRVPLSGRIACIHAHGAVHVRGGMAQRLDSLQMFAETAYHVVALSVRDHALEFIQREVNDVVMMHLFFWKAVGSFEPKLMQEVNLFWREAWCMRAEVKNLFLARGRENLKR